jgi:tRNA1(Val) A37 N6-methylase TrmN6
MHYTPPDLARFLALKAMEMVPKRSGSLKVLDPSCGDGALLASVAELAIGRNLILCGMDQDPLAIAAARQRLASLETATVKIELHEANFLQEVLRSRDSLKNDDSATEDLLMTRQYDLVIANPPYVRTQVMGSAMAKQLATQFGLSGRIDLYQAFVVGIAEVLKLSGTMALLCSNRFMTTKSGRDLRELLATKLQIEHIYDLGDTKQFSASVLPAIVIANKKDQISQSFDVTSVYESHGSVDSAVVIENVLSRLHSLVPGIIEDNGRRFTVRCATITPRNWDHPWVVTSEVESELQRRIKASTVLRFKDVGKIRVGIKTTSDKIFIRRDWSDLPEDVRPEAELLLPLLTHQSAARWRTGPSNATVLYPYELGSDKRVPVDLSKFPRAERYLLSHRASLEARTYVTEGGREWWEIWVPQRPSAWQHRKLVFPDISDEPKFSMDDSGSVVNGDCYWMLVDENDVNSFSLLMLAVANSTLGSIFYDYSCGNKLYAGRRRYITQYVSEFPIPDPSSEASKTIIRAVKILLRSDSLDRQLELERELDDLVWRAFGIHDR